MSIRVLCIGANGWIGGQLFDLLRVHKSVADVIVSNVRPQNIKKLRDDLDRLKPTHVLSTIGRTHGMINGVEIPTIDYLEHEGKLIENLTDNLYAPLTLAHECKKRSIHYTYLGTGCIFEYDAKHELESGKGFTEDDEPNFFGSSYSIVKGITDQLMHQFNESALNVRIRMPITIKPSPRDFITKIVNYTKICSMANSMTVLDELLPLLVDMMVNGRTGTIQLTNPGTVSHEEILTMYKELVDPNKTWETMTYDEQSRLLKSKRSNNELDTTLLQLWYPHVRHIRDAVRSVLEERSKMTDSAK
jgi:3,5-epimerase/4-reductase